MTITTPSLTNLEVSQIANIETYVTRAGLTIHEADTEYGPVRFTIEALDGGQIWGRDVLTVNRIPHALMGRYRLGFAYDDTSGTWAANPEKPVAHVGGYPGLRRKDLLVDFSPAPPTESAAAKLSQALGQAIAPFFADPTEALANERELAAQAMERKASQAEDKAERELERAMHCRAEAVKIRSGGTYDARGV